MSLPSSIKTPFPGKQNVFSRLFDMRDERSDYQLFLTQLIDGLDDVEELKKHIYKYIDEDRRNWSDEILEKEKELKIKYTHCLKIYYSGISCKTLLGTLEGNLTAVQAKFKNLLYGSSIIDKLNEQGIRVKIRYLFPYPYSDFFYGLVDGEGNAKSPEKTKAEAFDIGHPIDSDIMDQSIVRADLNNSLRVLQDVIEKSKRLVFGNHDDELNNIEIRFTAFQLNICALFFHNFVFADPYTFTKPEPGISPLKHCFPIVSLKHPEHDDFQYLKTNFDTNWSCEASIFLKDAFSQDPILKKWKYPITRISKPEQITFKWKEQRICSKFKIDLQSIGVSKVEDWRIYQKNKLLGYCKRVSSEVEHNPQIAISATTVLPIQQNVQSNPLPKLKPPFVLFWKNLQDRYFVRISLPDSVISKFKLPDEIKSYLKHSYLELSWLGPTLLFKSLYLLFSDISSNMNLEDYFGMIKTNSKRLADIESFDEQFATFLSKGIKMKDGKSIKFERSKIANISFYDVLKKLSATQIIKSKNSIYIDDTLTENLELANALKKFR